MNSTIDPLTNLAMWSDWQKKVEAALPNFCANTIYVEQESPPVEEFEEEIRRLGTPCLTGMMQVRDHEFGARVVKTRWGALTRMYLDSEVEVDFIIRSLLKCGINLDQSTVLDIGAGYGRLAAALHDSCDGVYTVDPVPVSVRLCREYCARFAPGAQVMGIPEYRARFEQLKGVIDLAVNVHSWNECSLAQIAAWATELWKLKVPYLFTVSHGSKVQPARGKEYMSWDRKDWRRLLEIEYELVAEENIGLGKHPHALWKRWDRNVSAR